MGNLLDVALIESTLRALTPILLAAIGGLICTRAGVFNIGLEGFMLVGCFGAVTGSWFSGSAWVGVVVAVIAGALMSLLLAYPAITLKADPIVIGLALNILAVGLTSFLLRTTLGARGTFQPQGLAGLPEFSGQSPLALVAWALIPLVAFGLRRTVLGFRLLGVGQSPDAARSLGISPTKMQYGAVISAGALCGLAGAQLALGNVTLFAENMTAGRGWVAVVVVMLGRAAPFGTLVAGIIFALADAVGFRLQGFGLPSQFTTAMPYLITLVALIIVSVRARRITQTLSSVTPTRGERSTAT